MDRLAVEQKNIILEKYNEGMSIEKIGRTLRKRPRLVSDYLRNENGIDVCGNRGIRIGNTQTGMPKPRTSMQFGIERLLTNIQWAYIAGIFDGEGCLTASNRSQNLRVCISQKETSLLCWLCDTIGAGKISLARNKANNQYRINVQRQVFDFLVGV